MHYGNLVIIEKTNDPDALKAAVEDAMGPNEQNGGFWDWYQIGGRWSGTLDGYEPEADPKNIVVCDQCNGTGLRTDAVGEQLRAADPEYKCNGCQGKGKHAAWPTQWATHPGDIVPIESVTDKAYELIFRVRVHDMRDSFGGERYVPWAEKKFAPNEMPPLDWLKQEYAGCLAVIVDNHC